MVPLDLPTEVQNRKAQHFCCDHREIASVRGGETHRRHRHLSHQRTPRPATARRGHHRSSDRGCGDVPRVLDTIRTLESGGDYTIKAAHASASGAYQIIDSTWAAWSAAAGVGTEYPARLASTASRAGRRRWPPRPTDPRPVPRRQLRPRCLVLPGRDHQPGSDGHRARTRSRQHPHTSRVPDPMDGRLRLEGRHRHRRLRTRPRRRRMVTARRPNLHRRQPRRTLSTPPRLPGMGLRHPSSVPRSTRSTPAPSTVSRTGPATATATETLASTCAAPGLTIQDTDGVRWIYCHASRLTVSLGDQVVAGQPIMLSGNTGHSSGPHLHLGIRIDGVDHCPQSLLGQLARLHLGPKRTLIV